MICLENACRRIQIIACRRAVSRLPRFWLGFRITDSSEFEQGFLEFFQDDGQTRTYRLDLYAYTTANSGGATNMPQNGHTIPSTIGTRIDAQIGTLAVLLMR